MIEQAIQGNDTAMMKLRDHYLSDKTKGMYMFYWHKFYETKYSLSYDEYKQLSEYAKNGNETAKERLKWHNNIPQHKQEVIYDYFDKDAEAMQNFLNDCSYDSFCNSSDIYEHYSQKAKNTNENKTQ
jgi:hypothetical protein